MRITINNQPLIVGWRYESPKLRKILQEKNITEEQARAITEEKIEGENGKMKRAGVPALLATLGIKGLPLPTVTHCIVCTEDRVEIARETVRKFPGTHNIPGDVWDKEKARKYSLGKLLHKLYPGEGRGKDKTIRTLFWDAYKNRNRNIENPTMDLQMTGAFAD